MKFKRFFLASFFLALLFSLTACTIPFTNKEITLPFFEKKAEVALGEMREKMDSVPYYKSDVDFSLNFKINVDKIKNIDDSDSSNDGLSSLESMSGDIGFLDIDSLEQYFKDWTLNLKIKNQIDQKEKDNKKQSNEADIKFLFNNGSWNFNFSSINLEDKQYLRINEVPMIMAMLLGQFVGEEVYNNWIEINFESLESGDALTPLSFYSGFSDSFLNSEKQEEMKYFSDGLEGKYSLLEVKERLSDEEIDGNKCYHYKVKINEEEFKKFFYEINGFIREDNLEIEEINEEDIMVELSKVVSMVNMDLWVDKKDFYLRKTSFSLNFDPSQLKISGLDMPEEAIVLELKGETKYYDFNKFINIEKPQDSIGISEIIENQVKKAKEELEKARVKARSARTLSDVKQIQTALEMYYSDVGRYPSFVEPGGEIFSERNTLMREIPSTVIGDESAVCFSDFDYVYGVNNERTEYQLIYCLETEAGGVTAGYKIASPQGINEKDLSGDEIIQVLSDFDGDGLCNYIEEEVYMTDPMKKDSDGDGYGDKDELKNGYNPNGEGEL